MSSDKVDIGILEEKCSWLLHPRFFPSKIGGKPAWLDLESIPHPKELTCKQCEEPMIMISQVSLIITLRLFLSATSVLMS